MSGGQESPAGLSTVRGVESLRVPNCCQTPQAMITAPLVNASTQTSHPGTARPYLEAHLSAAPAPAKMAVACKLRRAHSLPAFHNQCFWCLASDHHVDACRDPVRCRECLRYGHRSATCSLAGRTPTRSPRVGAARRFDPLFSSGSGSNTCARSPRPRGGNSTPTLLGTCRVLGTTFVAGAMFALARTLSLSGVPNVVVPPDSDGTADTSSPTDSTLPARRCRRDH